MSDEDYLKFMAEQGVDEAQRLAILDAWHKVKEELQMIAIRRTLN